MNRREFLLRGSTATLALGLAGCSSNQREPAENDEPAAESTRAQTPAPKPAATWYEERLSRGSYKVSVEVHLNGADFLEVRKGSPSGDAILSVSNAGLHPVAGKNTTYGTASVASMLFLVWPREDRTIPEIVNGHTVGSQTVGGNTPAGEPEQATPEETEEAAASPNFLGGISGKNLPDTSNEESHRREFTQRFRNQRSKFTLSVPDTLYDYYEARPRIADYSAYLADMFDESVLDQLAGSFEQYGKRNDHTDREIVDHAIAWVQGMKYTQDKPATGYNEYPKYPIETLYDRGGDCEDTSILLAGLFEKLGYGTRLLILPQANHMAVGVAGGSNIQGSYYTDGGTRFYYVETTGSGWQVGEVPDDVKEAGGGAKLEALDGAPVLALQWGTRVRPSELRVGLTIHNVGSRPASNVIGQVDIEDSNENVVAQQRTSYPSIGSEQSVTRELVLHPPTDRKVRLKLGGLLNGNLNDLAKTEYKTP